MSAEKVAHTPGPWIISRDPRPNMEWNNSIAVAAKPHLELCQLYHSGPGWTAQDEANARLIASAPDLLALAKRYASECAWCSGTGTIEHVPFDNGVSSTSKCIQCADIRAVIEKAEGGA